MYRRPPKAPKGCIPTDAFNEAYAGCTPKTLLHHRKTLHQPTLKTLDSQAPCCAQHAYTTTPPRGESSFLYAAQADADPARGLQQLSTHLLSAPPPSPRAQHCPNPRHSVHSHHGHPQLPRTLRGCSRCTAPTARSSPQKAASTQRAHTPWATQTPGARSRAGKLYFNMLSTHKDMVTRFTGIPLSLSETNQLHAAAAWPCTSSQHPVSPAQHDPLTAAAACSCCCCWINRPRCSHQHAVSPAQHRLPAYAWQVPHNLTHKLCGVHISLQQRQHLLNL